MDSNERAISQAFHKAQQELIKDIKTKTHSATADALNELVRSVPVKTGALKKSIKIYKSRENKKNNPAFIRYGITFDGYDDNGVPFQLIANSINANTSNKFIDKVARVAKSNLQSKLGEIK